MFMKMQIFCVVEPKSFEAAMKEKCWRKAMENEIEVIEKNKTWELVETKLTIIPKQPFKHKFINIKLNSKENKEFE